MNMKYKDPEPIVIKLKNVRLTFARIEKAEARLGKDGKPKGEGKFSASALLDPSSTEHAALIKMIKVEGKRLLDARFGENKWPKTNFYLCFGEGNKLDKVYDGYADMFYIKAADKNRPLIVNRSNQPLAAGDPQFPYSGCYVNMNISLWTYDNESRGLGANLRSIQFVRDGDAFGGAQRSPDTEFEALEGDAGKDAFDDGFG